MKQISSSLRFSVNLGLKVILIGAIALLLISCSSRAIIDLSPDYKPVKFVVPEDWSGSGPFEVATPADSKDRGEWWKVFNDPVLNELEDKLNANNPELQIAAEWFIQARYEMMKVRSSYLPHVGVGVDYTRNQRTVTDLLHGDIDSSPPNSSSSLFGLASWEPDIWSSLRNATTAQVYKAQESAAQYGAIKLMLQAELASHYFTLRGFDAQNAIYQQSIEYYKKSLNIINTQFQGNIGSKIDVARSEFLLANTEARQLNIEAERQVTEHAIAILLSASPTSFKIAPVGQFNVPDIKIPDVLPAKLLERRPDIAALERRMAQANKMIGISRAAFFPNINLNVGESLLSLINSSNFVWSFGSILDLNLFKGGYRRAQLQQSWSIYRETLNEYRSGVLNAFMEVENGISKTQLISQELQKQKKAVASASQTQTLSMKLFRGGLDSGLQLIYSQVDTLESRIREAEIKSSLMQSSVFLIRSLGGGWSDNQLPKDDEIQPFSTFQYTDLDNINTIGGIPQSDPQKHANLSTSNN